jgi:Calcineurin-like phosphoesterase superfamily domain
VSVAAPYDVHGDLPALEAVLAELQADPPHAVVAGGDVAAGPQPLEVLARLRAVPWPVHRLRGNADRALVMSFDAGSTWTASATCCSADAVAERSEAEATG